MRLFTLSRKYVPRLVLLISLLLVLLVGQRSWSAPAEISPSALANRLYTDTAPLILDVRSAQEYAAGHIPGAINLPYRQISDRWTEMVDYQTAEVVVYCEVGVRASIAEDILEQAGFQHVLTLEGDMQGWRAASLPVEPQTTP